MSEAQDEARRRWPLPDGGWTAMRAATAYRQEAFVKGAEWQAARDADRIAELEAEVERARGAAKLLGGVVADQCQEALAASGLTGVIDSDGEGDWWLVWGRLHENRARAEAAEEKLAEVRDALANPDIPYDDERLDAIRAALDETEKTT